MAPSQAGLAPGFPVFSLTTGNSKSALISRDIARARLSARSAAKTPRSGIPHASLLIRFSILFANVLVSTVVRREVAELEVPGLEESWMEVAELDVSGLENIIFWLAPPSTRGTPLV